MFDSLNSFKLIAKEWWNEKEGEIGHLSFSISSSSQRRHRRTRDFCNCTSANVYSDNHDTHIHSDYHLIIIMEERFLSPLQSYIFLVLFLLSTLILFFLFLTFLPYILATWKRIIFMISCVSFLSVFFFAKERKKEAPSEFLLFFIKKTTKERMVEEEMVFNSGAMEFIIF